VGAAALCGVPSRSVRFLAGVVYRESDRAIKPPPTRFPFKRRSRCVLSYSVGMLFDPTILIHRPWLVLATVVLIMFGSLWWAAVALGVRQPLPPRS